MQSSIYDFVAHGMLCGYTGQLLGTTLVVTILEHYMHNCTCLQLYANKYIQHPTAYIPLHDISSPLYPLLHSHVKDPGVLVQEAFAWQGDSVTHSLISADGRVVV